MFFRTEYTPFCQLSCDRTKEIAGFGDARDRVKKAIRYLIKISRFFEKKLKGTINNGNC